MRRILLGLFGGAIVLASACDAGDDTVQPLSKKDAGGDATTGGDAGGTEGGVINTNSTCFKIGGFSKVQAISSAVLKAASADCRIGAYFTGLALTEQTHFTDCFAKQLGEMLQCDGVTYAGSIDSLQVACRSLADAHQAINPQITAADFDAFVADVTSVMKQLGVSTADLGTIAPLLNGTRGPVQQSADNTLGQTTCDAGAVDDAEAGADGATDSDSGSDTGADADDAG